MKNFIVAIDQGTTSTRSILFDLNGKPIFTCKKEFKQYFPKNGWVEHNPNEIWKTTINVLTKVINKSKKLKGKILTIGITNQRETIILWDKKTGKCVYNAIVWQDRRTHDLCKKLKKKGYEKIIRSRTGLILDPYFSGTKIKWILDNVSIAKKLLKKKRLLFGTIDTYLVWKLTSGKIHATDSTNASRTMIFNIKKNVWDKKLLNLLKIPESILPYVKNSADNFGETSKSITNESYSINGIIGDQQAAAIGQGCFKTGSTKITFGTGAFAIMNTGNKILKSKNKLLSTICYRIDNKTTFALEGSIFIAGAGIQWLRDKLKIIKHANVTEKISLNLKNNNNVYFVPAFTGLGAPYWDPEARGALLGMTRDTGIPEIVAAGLMSVVYQTKDLVNAISADGAELSQLRVDGGLSANNFVLEKLADIVNCEVHRPKVTETTAQGAAYVAGLQLGVFSSLEQIKQKWQMDLVFKPTKDTNWRENQYLGWKHAIQKVIT